MHRACMMSWLGMRRNDQVKLYCMACCSRKYFTSLFDFNISNRRGGKTVCSQKNEICLFAHLKCGHPREMCRMSDYIESAFVFISFYWTKSMLIGVCNIMMCACICKHQLPTPSGHCLAHHHYMAFGELSSKRASSILSEAKGPKSFGKRW